MKIGRWIAVAVLGLALVGTAAAQTTRYGDVNHVAEVDWRSGMPVVLTLSTQDMGYEFDGNPLNIPFTITGTRATVFLAVYSNGANPDYDGEAFKVGGIGNAVLRAAGLDTLIALTSGQSFAEGSHTIAWDGNDFNGNAVAAGDYDFYLFAIDDVSTPTWTGRNSSPNVWSNRVVDFRFEPPVVWSTSHVNSELHRTPMGTDLFENPDVHTVFPLPWMIPRLTELKEDFAPGQWDFAFLEIDPNDPNIAYPGNYYDPAGPWKVQIDLDNMTVDPVESFGDNGKVVWEQRTFNSTLMKGQHHDWLEDDGLLYLSWMDRTEPFTPGIVILDRSTGEVANIIDVTDLYVSFRNDAVDAPYVPGPSGVDVDDTGIYVSSYWMDSPHSFPAKFSHDGDLLWQNQNGDGFVDRYITDEAEALGIVVADQMVNTHMLVSRWGISYGGGYNDPSWGYVMGPDGTGLFKLNLPHMPASLGGDVQVIDRGSDFDGLWIPTDGHRLTHWPFDVSKAMISEGVSTDVAEIEAALPGRFALGDASPNPFNPETAFRFEIPNVGEDLHVHAAVYNMAGQEITVLADQVMHAGTYRISWDGRDANGQAVGSGVYMYRVQAGDRFAESKRMTLLK